MVPQSLGVGGGGLVYGRVLGFGGFYLLLCRTCMLSSDQGSRQTQCGARWGAQHRTRTTAGGPCDPGACSLSRGLPSRISK